MKLEAMTDFFTARVDGYDEHMLECVEGCKEGYIEMARLVPNTAKTLLDLGCGTGLELDEIFKILPDIKVTGIDLTQAMLQELLKKHSDKSKIKPWEITFSRLKLYFIKLFRHGYVDFKVCEGE